MRKNVKDWNIFSDEKQIQTDTINQAIKELSNMGGGELVFDEGIYITGTIILQNNVILNLQDGAKIRSSGRKEDYIVDELTGGSIFEGEDCMGGTLIWGENLKNVGIIGRGIIDGNGIFLTVGEKAYLYPEGQNNKIEDWYNYYQNWRPITLKLYNCSNVVLEGVKFTNPASWNIGLNCCKDIYARGLEIKSYNFFNGDGLDFNSCENVNVSDCVFDCTDDCIALQSAYPNKSCKDILISNCKFTSLQAGIRLGMACLGDFENINVSNCIFDNCDCGLKIQQCETGKMENMNFNGLIMKNVNCPFFFTHNFHEITKKTLRDSLKEFLPTGTLKNIIISNCTIDNNDIVDDVGGLIFDGTPNCKIENIILNNVIFSYKENYNGNEKTPELENKRPERTIYTNGNTWGAMLLRNCQNCDICGVKLFTQFNEQGTSIKMINSENITLERIATNGITKKE